MAAVKQSSGIIETIKTVVYAGAIAIVIRTVAYEPFNIPSASMVPSTKAFGSTQPASLASEYQRCHCVNGSGSMSCSLRPAVSYSVRRDDRSLIAVR